MPSSSLPLTPSYDATPALPEMREFGDAAGVRANIYDQVLTSAKNLEPAQDAIHTLQLSNLRYIGPERHTKKDEKQALLTGTSLTRKLRGDWELVDNATGKVISTKSATVAHVPTLSDNGTIIHNGNVYGVAHQLRLLPGVYSRRKANDELEAHVNTIGHGAHRLFLEPQSGVFRIKLGQAQMPLLPLMRALGAKDSDLREAWGNELLASNTRGSDTRVIQKLYERLVKKKTPGEDQAAAVADAFRKMQLNPAVTKETLGEGYTNVDLPMMLATTKKLLALNRGEATPDDRDHMAYQQLLGPEDLLAERIGRDRHIMRQLLWKATARKSLDHVHAGVFDKALQAVLLSSGLGQNVEGINPLEIYDQQARVTRLGEGGIRDSSAVPQESRTVQPSHLGFIDLIRTPESSSVGVDLRMSRAARKGRDGKVFTTLRNVRTNKAELKSPQELAQAIVAFPGELNSDMPMVPALVAGKLRYVPRETVQFELPSMEDSFSPLGNMVPGKSMIKGQRVSMASRMLTQALPLLQGEAPLVQSALPTNPGRSYEEEYGKHAGAVFAQGPATVLRVTGDEIQLKGPDGKIQSIELDQYRPYGRKTYLHQTAAVQPGDQVQPGQLLAHSNYTDRQGAVAMGSNLRVAYLAHKGHHYEDANVISESAAQRLSSLHMYGHDVETVPDIKRSKNTYISTFPSVYPKQILENFDQHGLVKPGTVVQFGDPLILQVQEKQRTYGQVRRNRSPAYSDATVTWDHHSPGTVTDVIQTPKGATVTVRATTPAEEGDKISGRMGDKGVISKILPDDQMPTDPDGKPYELLLNPLGLVSRVNPGQIVEAALGKVAAKTGKPYKYKDWDTKTDPIEFAKTELRKHGLTDTEDVIDPATGRKIAGVLTGNRFIMKLHHTSECYDDKTEVLSRRGWLFWRDVTAEDDLATVAGGQLVFERPLELIAKPYTGPMYTFAGRYVDYAVTPNHNMWIQGYGWQSQWGFRRADEIHSQRFKVTQFGLLPAAATHAGAIQIGAHQLNWDDYAALTGWWVTEGYAKVTPRRACVMIYQSESANPAYFQEIEALLRRLPFKWHYYAVQGEKFGFGISSRDLAIHFKAYGTHSNNKRLPREILTGPVSGRWQCFSAMMRGDGSVSNTPTGDSHRFTTTSKHLADDFQELCVRIGLGAVVRACAPRKETHYLPAWHCGVAMQRTTAQIDGDRNKQAFNIVQYNGQVYCATMRTGLLYVRRNGKPMLCGNSKGQGRGLAAYSAEGAPAKGGEEGAKRVGILNLNALLSHGAGQVIRDIKMYRGQAHPEYWSQYAAGFTPTDPKVPHMFEKFVHQLRGSGIQPFRSGSRTQLLAMTDKDINELAGDRELQNAETVDWKGALRPIPGGLFDETMTGGHGGNKWQKITLHEPMPSPVMEEPIRRLLDLTVKDFREVLAGKQELHGLSGPQAIQAALTKIDLPKAIAQARADIASGKKTARDQAVRKLGYLAGAQNKGEHPKDWMWHAVPVIPPNFRPVSTMGPKKLPLVADANYLYRELFDANQNLKGLAGQVDDVGDERLTLYDSVKAVTGLGEPLHPKNVERNVKGFLSHIFGPSPKFGTVNRKLLSATTDLVGRAVIAPNPDLGLDHIGLPEDRAWDIYRPFIIRNLVRRGMPRLQAARAAKDRLPVAREALLRETDSRPVIVDRAPVLHRYGVMAFYPRLVSGHTLQLNPFVYGGFGADNDGDAMQYHVPGTDAAAEEAVQKMLPSKNLFSVASFSKVNYKPGHEYLGGLYTATARVNTKNAPRVFASTADAVKAYHRGDVGVDQRVIIQE